ncbi:kinase domain protein, partial [Rhizoctonia solani AG-3 Rhs1AP]
MPPIEELGVYTGFVHSTEYQINNLDPDTESDKRFAHRLFHDAESTFWVIAWTLASYDSRSKLCERSEEYWESVLHPDLKALSGMLTKMFSYIRPEWAYRPELHPEHVHEALMRLLLTEIVRIEDSGEDVLLAIGGRARPPPPPEMAHCYE